MTPPKVSNVLDRHNGFTAITKAPTYKKVPAPEYWRKVWEKHSTVWRPGIILTKKKEGARGELQEFDEKSFYQGNNNVTKAIYKVKGYQFRIAVWFDNETQERIA